MANSDKIFIKNLLLRGIVGLNDWEREKLQDILINVTLTADVAEAGSSDELRGTPNYRNVAKEIARHVESSRRYTVEALATDLARICLAESGVRQAKVRVEKPGAVRFSESVGVEIIRDREDLPT